MRWYSGKMLMTIFLCASSQCLEMCITILTCTLYYIVAINRYLIPIFIWVYILTFQDAVIYRSSEQYLCYFYPNVQRSPDAGARQIYLYHILWYFVIFAYIIYSTLETSQTHFLFQNYLNSLVIIVNSSILRFPY